MHSHKPAQWQRRGREGSCPPSPRTDPGVRNYRTGLFRDTRFRMITFVTFCYLSHRGLHTLPSPSCPACVSFTSYVSLSVPSPRELCSHVIGPTVSEYYGLIRLPDCLRLPYFLFRFRLPVLQELSGSPKFSTFLSTHATLFVDPGRPSGASPYRLLCVGF